MKAIPAVQWTETLQFEVFSEKDWQENVVVSFIDLAPTYT